MTMANPFDYHDLITFDRDELVIQDVIPVNSYTKVFRHQNLVKKAIYFLVVGGVRGFLRTYQSNKLRILIGKKSTFVIARVKGESEYYGGLQFSLDQPKFYFLRITKRMELPKPEDYNGLVGFNPFIGCFPDNTQLEARDAKNVFSPIVLKEEQGQINAGWDLYLIGAGNYPRTTILPHFKGFNRKVAVDFNYEILASKHLNGFAVKTNDFCAALEEAAGSNSKCGVITSYHSYHVQQAVDFLKLANSKVIIEKPPCLTKAELSTLLENFDPRRVFIGYNRRFLPWNEKIRNLLARHKEPTVINMIVTETQTRGDHWYYAPNQGTKISGNICHWVDLAVYLLQRKPCHVSVARSKGASTDYCSFAILFEDGSIVTLTASDLGDGTKGVQEEIFVRNKMLDIHVENYMSMRIWEKGKVSSFHKIRRDKGHFRMYKYFRDAIVNDKPSSYTKKDLLYSSLTYLTMIDLYTGNQDSANLEYDNFGDHVFDGDAC